MTKDHIMIIIILILLWVVIFQAIRTPNPPPQASIQAQHDTINRLTIENTRLKQDALKWLKEAQNGRVKADSLERVFLKQKQGYEKLQEKFSKQLQEVKSGDAKKQVEILEEHLK